MTTLSVSHFSCLTSAEIELGKFTILIGPQARGKSVLSKLIYFCYGLLNRQFRHIEDGATLESFQDAVVLDFKKWFPPTAWGAHAFSIRFQAGPLEVDFRRGRNPSKFPDRLSVAFSEYFCDEYRSLSEAWSASK
jgi:hypothetical protein